MPFGQNLCAASVAAPTAPRKTSDVLTIDSALESETPSDGNLSLRRFGRSGEEERERDLEREREEERDREGDGERLRWWRGGEREREREGDEEGDEEGEW